jgi:hypothetical protein
MKRRESCTFEIANSFLLIGDYFSIKVSIMKASEGDRLKETDGAVRVGKNIKTKKRNHLFSILFFPLNIRLLSSL